LKITDVIKDIIASVDSEITVNEVKQLDGSYELLTCNYKHATKCSKVSIGEAIFNITGYSEDGLIVTGDTIPEVGVYTIEPVTFLHGTFINANEAMLFMDNNQIDFNVVAFFVSSPLSETADYSVSSTLKTSVNVQLLLLKSNNSNDWQPNDHYTYAIYPMRSLSDLVVEEINDRRGEFNNVDSVSIDNLMDVGIEKTQSKSLFSYTFSGVVMDFQLPILRTNKCCNS